jgi:hypothetical protein
MPFTFIIAGLILLIAAARGQSSALFALVKSDFTSTSASTNATNQPSFLPWVFSILAVGALGYIPALKTFSRAFLVLLLVVLFLSKGGFFAKFEQAFPGVFAKGVTPAAQSAAGQGG